MPEEVIETIGQTYLFEVKVNPNHELLVKSVALNPQAIQVPIPTPVSTPIPAPLPT